MGEIAQVLQQRVGLSPEQAQSAETEVIALIRSRVPAQFQGMVGSILGSGEGTGDDAAPAAGGGLGGLLGEAESMFGQK